MSEKVRIIYQHFTALIAAVARIPSGRGAHKTRLSATQTIVEFKFYCLDQTWRSPAEQEWKNTHQKAHDREKEGILSLLDKREDQKPLPPSARE